MFLFLYSLGGLGCLKMMYPFKLPNLLTSAENMILWHYPFKSWPYFKNKRWCRLEIIVSLPEIHIRIHKNWDHFGHVFPFRTVTYSEVGIVVVCPGPFGACESQKFQTSPRPDTNQRTAIESIPPYQSQCQKDALTFKVLQEVRTTK